MANNVLKMAPGPQTRRPMKRSSLRAHLAGVDPDSLQGTEGAMWFERARRLYPHFDPAAATEEELRADVIKLYLWREHDRQEEAMELLWAKVAQDATLPTLR